MTEHRPRFTLELRLKDHESCDRDLGMAIAITEQVRISTRDVDDIKLGAPGGAMSLTSVVTIMKRRLFRKQLFIDAAQRLGALLAERMEDAEGWHDESRVEPARKQLGGRWR